MQSLAERTRAAVRADPVVHDALRAGVVNYAAAARRLDVDGDDDAVATALTRFEDDLVAGTDAGGTGATDAGDGPTADDCSVRMHRGVGPADGDGEAPLLTVADTALAPDGGDWTAVVATGSVDLSLARHCLGRLDAADVTVHAAGYTDDALVAVVGGRDGAAAVRAIEGDGA